jgi:hypothetical protein
MKYKLKFGFLDSKNGMVKKKKIYLEDEEVGSYSGQVRNGEILEPEPGMVYKEAYGNIEISESEAEKLNRINIFSKQRKQLINQNPNKASDLNLYYYSETNPLEYVKLRSRIEESIESITLERPEGRLSFEYRIQFTQTGNNKSEFLFKDGFGSVFQFKLEDAVAKANISPSMNGDKYTKN